VQSSNYPTTLQKRLSDSPSNLLNRSLEEKIRENKELREKLDKYEERIEQFSTVIHYNLIISQFR
jgi:hypothetical protein